jgi:flagellar protein FliS
MIPGQFAAQSDTYLLQRIRGASPEQLCVLLMEGAQRFLLQAVQATKSRNIADKAKYVNRVSAIIEELTVQLNHDEENELVVNLNRIYEWWMSQLFEASRNNDAEKFEMINGQIDSIKATWEELIRRGAPQAAAPVGDMVGAGGLGGELIG